MDKRIHETVSGHRIVFDDPEPKLGKFLRRVQEASRSGSTENELVSMIFSDENPLLEKSPVGAPLVTKETLAHPVHRVLQDLLERARIAERGVDVENLSAGYTLTVSEAAERLDMHESAVRQAINAGRLAAWVKEGRYYLHPKWVAQFRAAASGSKRGPKTS